MRSLLRVALAAGAFYASAPALADDPANVDSTYAIWLSRLSQRWSPPTPNPESDRTVALTCIGTADHDRYVGILQRATIHAGIAAVEAVLDDIKHYKDLFPDTVDVHIVPGSQHGGRYVTAWEQRAPISILPNVAYELEYSVDKIPTRAIYRYNLHRGAELIASDGLLVLDAVAYDITQFTEYDFFLAHWGPLPASVVWRESLSNAFLSDMAIALKAENPDWSYERIASEARRMMDFQSDRMDRCFADRVTANLRGEF